MEVQCLPGVLAQLVEEHLIVVSYAEDLGRLVVIGRLLARIQLELKVLLALLPFFRHYLCRVMLSLVSYVDRAGTPTIV